MHREEVLIGDNIIRMGSYKLIAGGGYNQTDGEGWTKGFLTLTLTLSEVP